MSKSSKSKSDWLLYFIGGIFESDVSKQEDEIDCQRHRKLREAKTIIESKYNQICISVFAVRKHEKITSVDHMTTAGKDVKTSGICCNV